MEIIIISVFVLGYFLITIEHSIKIDKLIPALAMMGIMWAIIGWVIFVNYAHQRRMGNV